MPPPKPFWDFSVLNIGRCTRGARRRRKERPRRRGPKEGSKVVTIGTSVHHTDKLGAKVKRSPNGQSEWIQFTDQDNENSPVGLTLFWDDSEAMADKLRILADEITINKYNRWQSALDLQHASNLSGVLFAAYHMALEAKADGLVPSEDPAVIMAVFKLMDMTCVDDPTQVQTANDRCVEAARVA